jgi:hypothetical protein
MLNQFLTSEGWKTLEFGLLLAFGGHTINKNFKCGSLAHGETLICAYF